MENNQKITNWELSDLFLVYAFVFSIALIINGFLYLFNVDANPIAFQLTRQISIYILLVATSYIMIKYTRKQSFKNIMGIDKNKLFYSLKTGIFIAFLLVLVTITINVVFFLVLQTEPQNPYEEFSSEKIKLISLIAVILAPTFEEIFFRGYMQTILSSKFGVTAGIVATAVIFALSHSQYGEYSAALVSVTAIGLVLGIAKEKTKSIMPGIVAHTLNNLLAALVLL